MSRTVKAIVTALLLLAFGAAVYFSMFRTARLEGGSTTNAPGGVLGGLAGKLTGVVQVQELSGLIAVDVEPY